MACGLVIPPAERYAEQGNAPKNWGHRMKSKREEFVTYRAWFRSFEPSEDFTAELTDVIYRSPEGHLLDVAHDVEALRY